jgi:hypothetical protein
MDFLNQTFTFDMYYQMSKRVFDKLGYDYYKGLKNKLPPIKYIETDSNNNELVIFAHPKDFNKQLNMFKTEYNKILEENKTNTTISYDLIKPNTISNKIEEIYEVYPSKTELSSEPNGFVALFVNDIGRDLLLNEFNVNDEINSLMFLQVTDSGIDLSQTKTSGVIDTFVNKFNKKQRLINKYKNLYLTIGEIKTIDIKTGITKSTEKYNIIGGKRNWGETTVQSTVRESQEELGLKSDSIVYEFINKTMGKTKDIFYCSSFNVYCVFYCPKNESEYNYFNFNFNKNKLGNETFSSSDDETINKATNKNESIIIDV